MKFFGNFFQIQKFNIYIYLIWQKVLFGKLNAYNNAECYLASFITVLDVIWQAL